MLFEHVFLYYTASRTQLGSSAISFRAFFV